MAYTDIDKPTDYFNTKLYTGNGGTNNITGVGFQPDWVWIKVRSTTYNHRVYDVVRGVDGNYAKLFPNLTNAENAIQTNELTSLDSDGFTLGNSVNVNNNGSTFASWNWLAGGTAVSNTDGSITSSVSANTTSGFSIVSYTGTGANATVGHGLGVAPKMIIVKNRNTTNSWEVYHASMGATKVILLNRTEAEQTSSSSWNNTAPTSTVFSIGTATGVNGNTNPIIAYCFAEKKGFSKFGSYTGNGSTDGPFIYTGFKPAFVLTKSSSNTSPWLIYDNKRLGYNAGNNYFYANASNAEASDAPFDILSNGFKFRNTFTDGNGSGYTYIYMAFAENPFVTSTGIPTTAR